MCFLFSEELKLLAILVLDSGLQQSGIAEHLSYTLLLPLTCEKMRCMAALTHNNLCNVFLINSVSFFSLSKIIMENIHTWVRRNFLKWHS